MIFIIHSQFTLLSPPLYIRYIKYIKKKKSGPFDISRLLRARKGKKWKKKIHLPAEFTSRTFSLCDRNRHSFTDYYDPLLFSLSTAIRFRRIKGTILLSFFFFLSALSSLRCSSPPSSLHFITLQSSRRAPVRRLWCPNEVSSLRNCVDS